VKAFVTGGTGFLGRRLVGQLLSRGVDVCCLVRPTSDTAALHAELDPGSPGRLEVCRGRLDQSDSYADALGGIDVVFHLAAELRGATAVLFA
jgi:dihydroflavonol-4-reductase